MGFHGENRDSAMHNWRSCYHDRRKTGTRSRIAEIGHFQPKKIQETVTEKIIIYLIEKLLQITISRTVFAADI